MEFGKPWAADGETRPRFFRTPLAWVDGFDGGVLYVKSGSQTFTWMMLSEWNAWVASSHAEPVIEAALDWNPTEVPECPQP